jgi:hypothetical protein
MRQEKVPIRTPQGIKDFTVRLVAYKEIRKVRVDNTPGAVVQVCGSLECDIRLERMATPAHVEVEVEFNPKMGVVGEIKQCLDPALSKLLDKVVAVWRKTQEDRPPVRVAPAPAAQPSDWNVAPKFAVTGAPVDENGKNERRVEWAKYLAALRKARKMGAPEPPRPVWAGTVAAPAAEAAEEPPAADETPVEQSDEAAQPDPETPVTETAEVTHG